MDKLPDPANAVATKLRSDFWYPNDYLEFGTWYKAEKLPKGRVYANFNGAPNRVKTYKEESDSAFFIVLLKTYNAEKDDFDYELSTEQRADLPEDRTVTGRRIVGFMVLEPNKVNKALI